jgi:glycogen(starch) synthase
MKILMTTDTVGGVWTYALELARSLREQGVQIALATMGAPVSQQQARQAARLDNVTLHPSTYKLEWMHDPWTDVDRAGRWLLELEAEFRPDVVHLNGYCHATLPFAVPVLVVAHSCCLSWWRAVKGEAAPIQWQTYRDRVAAGIHAADVVIAPSEAMLRAVCENYGRPPKSLVIYNGRHDGTFSPGSKQPFILSAGRLWDEAKNLTALEAVAPEVDWPIQVAGDAAEPDADGKSVCATRVRLLGKRDEHELASLMSAAAIYALPARYEPFGLSVLEAAMSGSALVLGDIPSLREIWDDSAVLVRPADTESLRAALNDLCRNAGRRAEMARRAQKRAQIYSTKRMARAYHVIYRQLVPGRALSSADRVAAPIGGICAS